jgi:hypothetical protein
VAASNSLYKTVGGLTNLGGWGLPVALGGALVLGLAAAASRWGLLAAGSASRFVAARRRLWAQASGAVRAWRQS